MELLFEIIFDLVFEGSIEIAKSRKVNKWIRYPLIVILSIFLILVIILISFIGITMILSKEQYSTYGGLFFILFDVTLIVCSTRNIIKEIKSRKSNLKSLKT